MSTSNAYDRQLWRDFDWNTYITASLPSYPTEKDRDEFKASVEIARNVARLMQDGAVRSNMQELATYERTIPGNLRFQVILILSMVANVLYQSKHAEAGKLTFAIGTVSRLATICRTHEIKESEPILKQFVHELGEDYTPREG